MKSFFRVTKGAISVFLGIIIIPIVTLTSVFVDSGKMILARSLAESSGDLALNTVLTNYDKQLNEYFGLIASAQDMDEACSIAVDFFKECMISAATEASEKSGLGYQIDKNLIHNKAVEYSDFLGASPVEGTVKIEPLENGSLANPNMLKKQIVEFMKYRGPINGLSAFCEWLFDPKTSKQMDQLDEISDMTDKKNEFYEEESSLMEKLKALRDKLLEYDSKKLTKQYMEDFSGFLAPNGDVDTFYKNLHKKIVYDYFNVLDNSGNAPVPNWGNKITDTTSVSTYPKIKITVTDEEGNATQKEIPDIEKAINDFVKAIDDYKTKESDFLALMYSLGFLDSSYDDIYSSRRSEINDLQYMALLNVARQKNSSTIDGMNECATQLEIFRKQLNMCWDQYSRISDESVKEKYAEKKGHMGHIDEMRVAQHDYFDPRNNHVQVYDSVSFHQYEQIVNDLKQDNKYKFSEQKGIKIYNSFRDRVNGTDPNGIYNGAKSKGDSLEQNGNFYHTAVDAKITEIHNKITDYYNKFDTVYDTLDKAVKLIDEINGSLKDYNDKFDGWETAANKCQVLESNDMVDKDKNEIAQKKGQQGNGQDKDVNETLLDEVTPERLDELKQRLVAIQAMVSNARSGIEDCKYFEKRVKDIAQLSDAMTAAKNAGANKESFYNSELKTAAEMYSMAMVEKSKVVVNTTDREPDLSINEPKLRKDLYEFFHAQEVNKANQTEYPDEDSAKDKKKSFKDKSEKDEEEFETKESDGCSPNEINKVANRPSSDVSADTTNSKSSSLSKITEMVQGLFNDFSGTMANVRDDLLMSEYIMSMFSYDTFKKELLLECADDAGDAPTSKENWNGKKSKYEDEYNNNKNVTYWKYNKNLRNIAIDSENYCYSYGNEIEYILYGGSNAENKVSAYCRIYGIRFVCDMIGIFKTYWGKPLVISTASAISAATMGVVPVSLVKLLICLGLTAVEAGMDLSYIREGFGIQMIKLDDKDLFVSAEYLASFIKGGSDGTKGGGGIGFGVKSASEVYLQYSDYLRLFLILKLMGSGEKDVMKRTGDVLQVDMRTIKGENNPKELSVAEKLGNFFTGKSNDESQDDTGFLLNKAQCYYNLSADISIKPLMLSMPINASENNPYSDGTPITTFTYSMTRGY